MISPKLITPGLLAKARSLFPHTSKGVIYFNHAATAPLSTRVVDAMITHLHERSSGEIDDYPASVRKVLSTKSHIQELIGAESPDRIALVGNTSDALNIVASGFRWKSGDRILLNDLEFPANVYPYHHLKRLGVEIEVIKTVGGKVTPDMVEAALKPSTRLVALSAVQFLSGYRADMATIGSMCREKGILFVVDGIQAVGAVRIDVQEMKIDALAAGGQKWQLGPQGTGFLYLTEELQSRVDQKYLGWLAIEDPWNFFNYDQPLARSARRYEGGTLNHSGIAGLNAALTTLLEFGGSEVEAHILALTDLLTDTLRTIDGLELLSPVEIRARAGIVTIKLPENVNTTKVYDTLNSQNIKLSLREGKLRFSPHFYNTPDEVLTSVEALRDALRRPVPPSLQERAVR